MEKLIEDYLNEIMYLSESKVFFCSLGTNVIDFTYTHEYNTTMHDLKGELSIWELLEFTYSKIK